MSAIEENKFKNQNELYRLELSLIGLPKRVNQAPGGSWHSKYAESLKWHKRVMGKMIVERKLPPSKPLTQAHLTLIRYSSVAPDYDGLVHSFKPVIDALRKCLIIQDDNMKVIGRPDYQWKQAKPNEGKIEIIVLEIAV